MENKDQPAYPYIVYDEALQVNWQGLTKREIFANTQMAAILSNSSINVFQIWDKEQLDNLASCAVRIADTLLKALEDDKNK